MSGCPCVNNTDISKHVLCTYNGIFAFTAERLGHLTVEFPPSFVSTPMKEAWSWDARPVNLTCLAEAIPNATITWIFMSNPEYLISESPPDFVIYGTQAVSTLQVSAKGSNLMVKNAESLIATMMLMFLCFNAYCCVGISPN